MKEPEKRKIMARWLPNTEGGEYLSSFVTGVVMGIPAEVLPYVPYQHLKMVYGNYGPAFDARN